VPSGLGKVYLTPDLVVANVSSKSKTLIPLAGLTVLEKLTAALVFLPVSIFLENGTFFLASISPLVVSPARKSTISLFCTAISEIPSTPKYCV
jgi:hypothetical protein